MEPEEEIAEAEVGEQRRLGTARRVSARTPRADSVRCRHEVRMATVAGFFPAESAIGVGIRAACGRRAAALAGTRAARRRGAVCDSRAR